MEGENWKAYAILIGALVIFTAVISYFVYQSRTGPDTPPLVPSSSPVPWKSLPAELCTSKGGVVNTSKTYCCNQTTCSAQYCGEFVIPQCSRRITDRGCDVSNPPCTLVNPNLAS